MDSSYQIAAKKLLNHGVIAFPTETVMGLGVVFDDEIAYKKLNIVKNRPEDKPYTLMLEKNSDIKSYALINSEAEKIINAFMPGPLTILLNVKKGAVPGWVTHNTDKIGIRVSSHYITQNIIHYTGKPLLVPSANKSGEKPAMSSIETKQIFNDELDYIFDGEAGNGIPSTILDLTDKGFKIIREGPITIKMIREALK